MMIFSSATSEGEHEARQYLHGESFRLGAPSVSELLGLGGLIQGEQHGRVLGGRRGELWRGQDGLFQQFWVLKAGLKAGGKVDIEATRPRAQPVADLVEHLELLQDSDDRDGVLDHVGLAVSPEHLRARGRESMLRERASRDGGGGGDKGSGKQAA